MCSRAMRATLTFLILGGPAHAQAVTDTELAAAMTECAPHFVVKRVYEPTGKSPDIGGALRRQGGWEAGWEHCGAVQQEYSSRLQQKTVSPDLSKDIVTKLKAEGK